MSYTRIALCKGKYFLAMDDHDSTLKCSCPAWTRNTPRKDCKHLLALRSHLRGEATGAETFVLMETDEAKPKIAKLRPKANSQQSGVTQSGPLLGAAQSRMQSYNTRPTPPNQCFRQGCKATAVAGSQFCTTHDPSPRPAPVPKSSPKSPGIVANRMANIELDESKPDKPAQESGSKRFSLIELD